MPIISKTALLFSAVTMFAQTPGPASAPEAQIRAVLTRQQAAWNRGDTESFLTGYAADTTFVGDKITRGLTELRVRYQTHYPTIASMGRLTFSDLEVHMLGADYAYVIGRWRLARTAEAGGDTGGVYTLVFRKSDKGWKIIVDHTS
jgi:uncharacterized protein (TIGR02246 family)